MTVSILTPFPRPGGLAGGGDLTSLTGLIETFGPEAEARVGRLITLYQRLGASPIDTLDKAAVRSILTALNEGRERDALDLLDIALESPDDDLSDADSHSEEEAGTPIPHAAMIWRYAPRRLPPLSIVAGLEHTPHQDCKKLAPQRTMSIGASHDWNASAGGLDFGASSHRAELQLGLKGEVFFVLFGGRLVVSTPEGKAIAEAFCAAGERRIIRIVYCAAKTRSHLAPMMLSLETDADAPAQGIWCHSGRRVLSEDARAGDPGDIDSYIAFNFIDIGDVAEAGTFCAGAVEIENEDSYYHIDSTRRGDFARFELESDRASFHKDRALAGEALVTTVTGMSATVDVHDEVVEGEARALVSHSGAVELIVAINGVTWVAVAADRGKGGNDDRKKRWLSSGAEADGRHTPAYVTPLASVADGGCDVMLLKPQYGHAVWMTRGSPSRFLHLLFDDPENIAIECKRGAETTAAAEAARSVARS